MKTQIDIYGRKYKVNSDYEARYIDRLTYYVNDKLRQLVVNNPRLDYGDACALCLLNVADDYMTEKEKYAVLLESQEDPGKEVDKLTAKLEAAQTQLGTLEKKLARLEEELHQKDNEIIQVKLSLEESYNRENTLRSQLEERDKKGE